MLQYHAVLYFTKFSKINIKFIVLNCNLFLFRCSIIIFYLCIINMTSYEQLLSEILFFGVISFQNCIEFFLILSKKKYTKKKKKQNSIY